MPKRKYVSRRPRRKSSKRIRRTRYTAVTRKNRLSSRSLQSRRVRSRKTRSKRSHGRSRFLASNALKSLTQPFTRFRNISRLEHPGIGLPPSGLDVPNIAAWFQSIWAPMDPVQLRSLTVATAVGGGPLTPSTPGIINTGSNRYFLHHYNYEMEVISRATVPIMLDVWTCRARSMLYSTPLVSLNAGFSQAQGEDFQGQFNVNSLDVYQPAQPSALFQDTNVTPFQSPFFCQQYKILKKRHYTFLPGETKILRLSAKNRIVDIAKLFDNTNSSGVPACLMMRGSMAFVCRYRSALQVDVSGGLGLPPVHLAVDHRVNIKYSVIANTQPYSASAVSYTASWGVPVTPANPATVELTSGTVQLIQNV